MALVRTSNQRPLTLLKGGVRLQPGALCCYALFPRREIFTRGREIFTKGREIFTRGRVVNLQKKYLKHLCRHLGDNPLIFNKLRRDDKTRK